MLNCHLSGCAIFYLRRYSMSISRYKSRNFYKIVCLILVLAFITSNFTGVAYAKYADDNDWDVLVIFKDAVVGGAIWDGTKWILSKGVELAIANPGVAATILALLAIEGLLLYAITLNKAGYVGYAVDTNGCRYSPDGRQINCPYYYINKELAV